MIISAIVFDLGNVVLTSDFPFHTPDALQAFTTYFGTTFDNILTAWEYTFPSFKLGMKSEDKFWDEFLTIARAEQKDISYAKTFWRNHQKENEHMLTLLGQLKKTYTLASLTTISREWLEFKRKEFHLDTYFSTIISSAEVGISKPDKVIYQQLLTSLNIDPQQTLFIDDAPANLPPAELLGMHTILFQGQEKLEKTIKALIQ